MKNRTILIALLAVGCVAGCRQSDTPVTTVRVDPTKEQDTYSSPQAPKPGQQATPTQQNTGYDNLRNNPTIPEQAKQQVLGGR
jgi:hypothetical protein